MLKDINADYVMVYNAAHYPKLRHRDDEFYKSVDSAGTLVASEVGTLTDLGRYYFIPDPPLVDTFKLYKIR